MSHITGTVQVLGTPLTIGPGTTTFNPPQAPLGTKFLILHFQNLNFRPGDQLLVNLGYATDTFTAADGPAFWTRPINVYAFPGGVPIAYVAAGLPTGSVQLDQYGRGERHVGESGHPSFSNCDPFYQAPAYVEPTYDPFWYCTDPPDWENIAAVTDPNDVRTRVGRSVGMILSVEQGGSGVLEVSTCSVTLVDTDKVLTAGHCHQPSEATNSSVTFDYLTLADGSRPLAYNARFYKVKAVLGHKYFSSSSLDYSLLQLAEAPVGIPAIQMRHDLPAVNELVFGAHHPNGAVKKLSLPHGAGFARVIGSSSSAINVSLGFDVSGGSSGSGLFDAAGRIVGVLSNGSPCAGSPLSYCPTANILADLVPAPPPPITRDVMLVFDRSGSMSMDDGTGRAKIDAARDAASLFVQLVRASTGNRVGLASFSTTASAPVDFALTGVTPGTKTALVGPAPYSTGIVGGLMPGGLTSIGGGIDAARVQLAVPGTNPKAILLMTDGLQNTAPMIADVEPALGVTTVHAIGFGTESSLDGAILTALTTAHDGMYMRASNGLALEKFFSSAFGNIFEAGILRDPEFDLPSSQSAGPSIPFRVCGESAITAVAGWDDTSGSVLLQVTTPGGAVITAATPGVETASGRTWTFLRIPLPIAGERDGAWSVRVVRPGGGGEFPPPAPALRYFVNLIASGGPKLLRREDTRRYYTGDRINPMVLVRYADGGWPVDMDVALTVTRPDTSVGTVLANAGLGASAVIGGDGIPARHATLQTIEHATGRPVARYTETVFDLSNESVDTDGLFESAGTFGKPMSDLLTVEGNYTFHATATYGDTCMGMRELVWSIHVDVGIDPGKTTVSTTPLDPRPDGGPCVRMRFTPRDKYGNLLGPGRADAFTVAPVSGSLPSGAVVDLGGGVYQVDVCADPDSLEPPQISVTQPGRPPVVIGAVDFKLFLYSVKVLCGEQGAECCGCAPVRPGRYATEVNIHNAGAKEARVGIRPIPLVTAGAASGREPKFNRPGKASILGLPAHSATMEDCCRIMELMLGAPPAGPVPLTVAILEIVSTVQLDVTAVYTAGDGTGVPAIDVQQIAARVLTT